MVEGERTFFERVAAILGQVEAEMVSERQQKEGAPPVLPPNHFPDKIKYFVAEAVHAFDAELDKELSLEVGDYVVVRKISPSGRSEGECRGRAGWFPSSYVEKRHRTPTSYTTGEVY
ncbi:scaffold/adaptor protein [Lithospermum erythrorhizon]|uniref:Scaffold/adaptor protein n=1 Tax=Lithospermum erythrorhizon TaxID=34254 RepID=A0AAV3NYC1_LITER